MSEKLDLNHLWRVQALIDALPDDIEGMDKPRVLASCMVAIEDAYAAVYIGLTLGVSMASVKRQSRELLETTRLTQSRVP